MVPGIRALPIAALAVLLPLLPRAAPAAARAAKVVDLGTLPEGGYSVAHGVNNRGRVVGVSGTSGGGYRGFLWENGRLRDLGALPGGEASIARAINDRGQIAGESLTDTGGGVLASHAVVWEKGRIRNLGVLPGGFSSIARGINRQGRVVGSSDNAVGVMLALGWSGERILLLGPGGHTYSYALDINDRNEIVGRADAGLDPEGGLFYGAFYSRGRRTVDLPSLPGSGFAAPHGLNGAGQVVGESETGTVDAGGFRVRHAVAWRKNRVQDLGTLPGGSVSAAHGINGAGAIVGTSDDATGAWRAVRWQRGQVTDLNGLLPAGSGWTLSAAYGVNDRGQVVGAGLHDGAPRAFLLTP